MRSMIFSSIAAFAIFGHVDHAAIAQDGGVSKPMRVAGYLPDYRFGGFEPGMAKGLTDLIVFSAELKADGTLDPKRIETCPWPRLQEWK